VVEIAGKKSFSTSIVFQKRQSNGVSDEIESRLMFRASGLIQNTNMRSAYQALGSAMIIYVMNEYQQIDKSRL